MLHGRRLAEAHAEAEGAAAAESAVRSASWHTHVSYTCLLSMSIHMQYTQVRDVGAECTDGGGYEAEQLHV